MSKLKVGDVIAYSEHAASKQRDITAHQHYTVAGRTRDGVVYVIDDAGDRSFGTWPGPDVEFGYVIISKS